MTLNGSRNESIEPKSIYQDLNKHFKIIFLSRQRCRWNQKTNQFLTMLPPKFSRGFLSMRFRCISKFYNSIVVEPNFVNLHLSHYSTINLGDTKLILWLNGSLYAIQDDDEDGNANKYHKIENFNRLHDHFNGAVNYHDNCESSNGLFCIWDVKYIAICNPSTSEVRFLPYLQDFDIDKYLIGFEPGENKYKVVLSIDILGGIGRAWVFTLGVDKSWREVTENGHRTSPYRSGVCISGIICRFSHTPEFCIVAFDVKSETFTTIQVYWRLYNTLHECLPDYILIQVKGKLGILNFLNLWDREEIYLWVLGEDEQWEEYEKIRFPSGWKDISLDNAMAYKYTCSIWHH
ncbi:putative F-box protein [Capsicum annuum]